MEMTTHTSEEEMISQEYIAQCAAANLPWEPKEGDRCWCKSHEQVYIIPNEEELRTYNTEFGRIELGEYPETGSTVVDIKDCVPLWSQEQLWGLLPKDRNYTLEYSGFGAEHEIYCDRYPEGTVIATSRHLESAILKLVMEINHNKTWDSDKEVWV